MTLTKTLAVGEETVARTTPLPNKRVQQSRSAPPPSQLTRGVRPMKRITRTRRPSRWSVGLRSCAAWSNKELKRRCF